MAITAITVRLGSFFSLPLLFSIWNIPVTLVSHKGMVRMGKWHSCWILFIMPTGGTISALLCYVYGLCADFLLIKSFEITLTSHRIIASGDRTAYVFVWCCHSSKFRLKFKASSDSVQWVFSTQTDVMLSRSFGQYSIRSVFVLKLTATNLNSL